jgi:hypothetical protein
MGAFRRHRQADEDIRARRRRGDLDPAALEAAAQTLLDSWPWLTEQYRIGAPPELPYEPVAAAIRRYLEHVGP